MPSELHELFIQAVAEHVEEQLRQARIQAGDLGQWTHNIASTRSADIELDLTGLRIDHSKRSPDASYKHYEAKFPGVVIEVSYSQKAKDLPRLADDYILGSNGNIKKVLGFDLEYRGSSVVKAYVWEPLCVIDSETAQPVLSSRLVYEYVSYRQP